MSKNNDEGGTTKPPLVLFGRYGGHSTHSKTPHDDYRHFVMADRSEYRARKISKKPELMGYSGGLHPRQISAAREQEQKWIDICLDPQKSRPRSS